MTTYHDDYEVDLDELMALIRMLRNCKQTLHTNLGDLRTQMQALQGTWEGQAAAAQAVAQHEWEHGMQTMNDALENLIAAKQNAHGNYTAAWTTNEHMWKDVSA